MQGELGTSVEQRSVDSVTPQSKPVILVCDDEPHIRHIIVSKLIETGYEVVEGRDGQEGLDHARSRRFDLVLTDYQMPRLSGVELAKQIRTLPGPVAPVIMLSARGYTIDDATLSAAGIVALIAKPFGVRQLMNKVAEVLAERAGVQREAA